MYYTKIKWLEFPMVIGRGRRREDPNQHFILLLRKNAGKNGHPQNILRTGSLRWSQSHVTSDQNCTTILVKKKTRGKSRACAEHTSGQGHFRSKGSTRADMAQLPVAHAQNILPDRVTSGHVTSGHVTSGHDPPYDSLQMWLELCPYTTDTKETAE